MHRRDRKAWVRKEHTGSTTAGSREVIGQIEVIDYGDV
jgi:hypothetical protein